MNPIPLSKQGFRVLGIAESFDRARSTKSIIVGVVMRRDRLIDGIRIQSVPIGGSQITDVLIDMYNSFNRNDIRTILLQGAIISWFNIVDLDRLHDATNLPIVSVTYEPSQGLEKYLKEYFPHDFESRIAQYRNLGERRLYLTKTGYQLYLYNCGISWTDAGKLVDIFIHQGRIPEPIKVAQLIAREIFRKVADSTLED